MADGLDDRFFTDLGLEPPKKKNSTQNEALQELILKRHKPRGGSKDGSGRRKSLASKSADRDVYDISHFDYNLLEEIEGMSPLFNDRKKLIMVTIQTGRLFLACSTLMIVMTDVTNDVPQDKRDEMGEGLFWTITAILRFTPPIFFALAYFQFNNFFAEKVYYLYLQRGAIIDYPETNSKQYYFKNRRPLIFLIVYILYFVYAFIVVLSLGGTSGSFIIMASSFTHIGLYWMRQQTVENQLISMTNFVQSFQDADGCYNNIDDCSLRSAARLMTHFTLIEAEKPCYSSYMRNFYMKMMGVPGHIRWGLRFGVYLVLFTVLGMTFLYSVFVQQRLQKSQWETVINPCVKVCVGEPTDMGSGEKCSSCLCRCLDALGERFRGCHDHFRVPNCNMTSSTTCDAAQDLNPDKKCRGN